MTMRTMFRRSMVFLGLMCLSVTNCSSPDAAAQNTALPNSALPSTPSPDTGAQQVAALTFSPPSGNYTSPQTVTIISTTSGASIRYTTDGSPPTETAGTVYSAPVRVETSETIRVIAYVAGVAGSNAATAVYTIGAAAATPSFLPAGGTYSSDQSVTISCASSGAVIHYTTDGSTPTGSSATYTAPIAVTGNGTKETIKAIATGTAMTLSRVSEATYVISYGRDSTPTFSPIAGTYSRDQSVAIKCSLPGAVIRYTTDGSTPTGSSATYTAPIAVAGNGTVETIKAVATGAGIAASSVGTAQYSICYGWQTTGAIGSGVNQFTYPAGVAVDAQGHVYVADQGNSRIVRMDDMDGTGWTTLGGTAHSGRLDEVTRLKSPAGIAVDARGRVYVADQGNSRIVRMDDMSGSGWTAFGSFGSGTNQFINPAGIAVDAQGRVYVADQGNSRIERIDDMHGTGWLEFGAQGGGANQFKYPAGVALDAIGHLYIADYANSRIVRMDDMNGTNWTTLGGSGVGTKQFKYPAAVAVDAAGHIYVADMINNRIVRMDDMNGTNWATFGSAGNQFNHPWGIEVNDVGRLCLADMLNDRIVRFIMP